MAKLAVPKLARDAGNVLIYRATWGGSQNFLGARWVAGVVDNAPFPARERVALRLLALSPHYFYDRDIPGEHARNRKSRQILANELIAPHLTPDARVLDYGCGPGYLASAVARTAAHVSAVDISRGVLACARVLNGGPNISYQTPEEFRATGRPVDVAYSFAVAQHLRSDVLERVLGLLATVLRPGGLLMLHFAVPDGTRWRTEADWRADGSPANRAKLRYALNCFGRSAAEMLDLVERHGFTQASARPLAGVVTLPGDDIPEQHVLTARRP
jgi:cyclopropane fatty-acyl-phospholipid synthase-like methyltransferase